MRAPHPLIRCANGIRCHDRLVTLVEYMRARSMHKRLAAASEHKRELYQRQTAHLTFAERGVDATDREIDKLVYNLYGLTEEEIRIIEETAR